jgi:hypothetical protein
MVSVNGPSAMASEPIARTDHQIVVAREDEAKCERAAQLRQGRLDRVDRLQSLAEQVIDQVQDDLGIGLGLEDGALFLQRLAQFAEILDDAVMDDGDAGRGVRMGVVLGRLAVGGPAGVADAGMARQRLGAQPNFKIFQFAFGAAALEMIAFQGGNARGIVAAIFKAF